MSTNALEILWNARPTTAGSYGAILTILVVIPFHRLVVVLELTPFNPT